MGWIAPLRALNCVHLHPSTRQAEHQLSPPRSGCLCRPPAGDDLLSLCGFLDQGARPLADDVLACGRHLPQGEGGGGPAREEVEQYQGSMPPPPGKADAASQGGVILGAICRAGVQADEAHAGTLGIPAAQESGAKQAAWGEGRTALHCQEFGTDESCGAKSPNAHCLPT